jgi:hypothetical protein
MIPQPGPSGAISSGPALNTPRTGATATTLIDGTVLIAAGSYPEGAANNGNVAEQNTAEIFDPVANTITLIAPMMITARTGQLGLLLPNNNNVLLDGGTLGGMDLSFAELYTPWGISAASPGNPCQALPGGFSPTASMAAARSQAVGGGLWPLANGLFLVAGGSNLASAELYGFPTIQTDNSEYAPGDPVSITGSGWLPGETVNLYMRESPCIDDPPEMQPVADVNGNLSVPNQYAPNSNDVGVRYYLTAKGATSQAQAQTTFADGPALNLTVVGPANSGTVTGTGINCSAVPTPGNLCPYTYAVKTSVTLTANPASGYGVSTWSGGGCANSTTSCTVSVSAAVNVTVTFVALQAPSFTSAANAYFPLNTLTTFTVAAAGVPKPTLGMSSNNFPSALSYTPSSSNPATATITGTPTATGSYNASFSASNGVSPNATQAFTLTVGQAPTITTQPANVTVNYGAGATFTSVASGYPTPTAQWQQSSTGTKWTAIATNGTGASFSLAQPAVSLSGEQYRVVYTNALASATSTAAVLTVNPLPISVASVTVADKVYDGTTGATITACTLTGVLTGDVVHCDFTKASATFASASAGSQTISVSGLTLSGTDAGNYVLSQTSASATGNITTKTLTATISPNSKPYDGTKTATLASCMLTGVVGSDDVTCSASTANFDSASVNDGIKVTASLVLGGNTAGNYKLTPSTVTGTANITAASVTATVVANKTYDGTTVATITACSLTGVIGTDKVTCDYSKATAVFLDANAGQSKPVTVSGLALSGADAGDYTLVSTSPATTANIAPLILTVTVTASGKTYDSTTAATISACTLMGVLTADAGNVTCSAAAASFADANVGKNKTVTVTGITLSGSAAGNYTLATTTATTTATITAASVTASIAVDDKPFDDTSVATVYSCTLTGVMPADTGNVTCSATATFPQVLPGNPLTVSATKITLSGSAAGNYVVPALSSNPVTASATITALLIPVVDAANKQYDGTTVATIPTCSLTGVLATDQGGVLCTASGPTFISPLVGTWTVSAPTIVLSGPKLLNKDGTVRYLIQATSLPATTTASINPAPLTVEASTASKAYPASYSVVPIITGFVNGEGPSVLTAIPTCSALSASGTDETQPNAPVGQYPTTCSGGTAQNYTFGVYKQGTLSVGLLAYADSFDNTPGPEQCSPSSPLPCGYPNWIVNSGLWTFNPVTYPGTAHFATTSDIPGLPNYTWQFTSMTLSPAPAANMNGQSSTVVVATDISNSVAFGPAVFVSGTGTTTTTYLHSSQVTGYAADCPNNEGCAFLAVVGDTHTNLNTEWGCTTDGSKTQAGDSLTLYGAIDSTMWPSVQLALYRNGGLIGTCVDYNSTVSPNGLPGVFGDTSDVNHSTSITAFDAAEYITLVASVTATVNSSGTPTITGCTLADSQGNTPANVSCSVGGPTYAYPEPPDWYVVANNISLGGTDAAKYLLWSNTATVYVPFALTPVTPTLTAAPKVYDGLEDEPISNLTCILTPVEANLGCKIVSAQLFSQNVGCWEGVATVGLTGTAASSYELTTTTVYFTGCITPATVIPTAITTANKTYDGNISATITGCALSGVIAPDVLSCSGTGQFSDPNVYYVNGSPAPKPVTISTMTLTGADPGNYVLAPAPYPATSSTINPASLLVRACGSKIAVPGSTVSPSACYEGFVGQEIPNTDVVPNCNQGPCPEYVPICDPLAGCTLPTTTCSLQNCPVQIPPTCFVSTTAGTQITDPNTAGVYPANCQAAATPSYATAPNYKLTYGLGTYVEGASVAVSDDFNIPATCTPGQPCADPNWMVSSGNWTFDPSNYPQSVHYDYDVYTFKEGLEIANWTTNSFQFGSTQSATIVAGKDSASGIFYGPAVMASGNTAYVMSCGANIYCAFEKYVNGAGVLLATCNPDDPVETYAGDVLTLQAMVSSSNNVTLTFWRNGVELCAPYTDTKSTLTTGQPGMMYSYEEPTPMSLAHFSAGGNISVTPVITALSKVWDGTSTATVASCVLVDAKGNPVVGAGNCSVGTANFTAGTPPVDQSQIGCWPVLATGISTSVAGYSLTSTSATTATPQPCITGTAVKLTATNVTVSKTYDGTTNGTVTGCTLTDPSGAVIPPAIENCAGTAQYTCSTVATSPCPVNLSLSNVYLTPNPGNNYQLVSVASPTTGAIAPLPIAVAITPNSKYYDGTATATIDKCVLPVLAADSAKVACSWTSAEFTDPTCANGSAGCVEYSTTDLTEVVSQPVKVDNLTLTGTAASNYVITGHTVAKAEILTKALTVRGCGSGLYIPNNPNPTQPSPCYTGFVNEESPAVVTNPPTCTLPGAPANPPAGIYQATCSGEKLAGQAAANYTLSFGAGNFIVGSSLQLSDDFSQKTTSSTDIWSVNQGTWTFNPTTYPASAHYAIDTADWQLAVVNPFVDKCTLPNGSIGDCNFPMAMCTTPDSEPGNCDSSFGQAATVVVGSDVHEYIYYGPSVLGAGNQAYTVSCNDVYTCSFKKTADNSEVPYLPPYTSCGTSAATAGDVLTLAATVIPSNTVNGSNVFLWLYRNGGLLCAAEDTVANSLANGQPGMAGYSGSISDKTNYTSLTNFTAVDYAVVFPSVTASDKAYDGTTTEPLSNITCTLTPSVPGLTCAPAAATLATANVGTGIALSATGITLSSTPSTMAGSYALASTSASTTANIVTAAQTITFPIPSPISYPDAPVPVVLTATASSTLSVTYTLVSGPATLSGSTLTVTGIGTIVVTANQAGNSSYLPAPPVSINISAVPAFQTITFPNPGSPTYSPTSPVQITLTATASSGLPVSYTVASGPASVFGSTLTITGGGSIVVTANQAGNSIYPAANSVSITITALPATPTITFPNPGTQTYSPTASVTLTATASSGLPVSYTVTSGPATVSGNTLTITGAGSVSVSATQAATLNFNAVTSSPVTFTVNKAAQTITFPKLGSLIETSAPITLNATATSGLPVTYTVTGPATVSGSTLTLTGTTGTVAVTANQAGLPNYNAATAVVVSFSVISTKATQTITFTSPGTQTYSPSGIVLTLSPTASSYLPVTLALNSGPATLSGSTSGSTLTITGAGTVSVTASQGGTSSYSAATPVTDSITVNKATPTITFPNPGPFKAITGTQVPLAATSTSGLPVTYTFNSGPATLSGSTLTLTGAVGNVLVTASQAATTNYNAASSVQISISITANTSPQTITFTNPGPISYSPSTQVTLAATASSGLPVTYTLNSGPATLSGTTLTITGAGSISVTASQAGNANYVAATSVTDIIVVNQNGQTITFPNPGPLTYPAASVALNATTNSGLPVSYTVLSGPATLSGSTLTITGAGSISVQASQAGNSNYTAATSVSNIIVVNPAMQTIAFSTPASLPYSSVPFMLSATASSGLPVTYTLNSGPATLSGATLSITGTGTISVQANQAGNSNYTATSTTESIVVNQASQTLSFSNPGPLTYSAAPIALNATATSGLPVTFTLNSGSATLSGSSLTITGPGTISVTASQAGNPNYLAAGAVTDLIVVTQYPQTITFPNPGPLTQLATPVALAASASSGLPLTYTLNSGPATLSGSSLTATGAGVISVTASQGGNSSYLAAAPVTNLITVANINLTLTVAPTSVMAGQAIQLTAATAQNGPPLQAGTITFLNGSQILGTAQVVGAAPATGITPGTASLTLKLSPGTYSLTAQFSGAGSTPAGNSAAQTLTVTGAYQTATTLTSQFDTVNSSNYDLTATVFGFGLSPLTGTVNFADITSGTALAPATLSSSTRTFLPQQTYPVNTPVDVASGDFNGDGNLDLAVIDAADKTVNVLLGNGDGTFSLAQSYAAGANPVAVVIGDFNADGILDLAVADQANGVAILLGNGDGTFQPAQEYLAATPSSLVVGDFNGDGIADLAVGAATGNAITVLLGNGDGTFQTPLALSTGTSPWQVATGDVNGDGNADLVVANNGDGTVSVLLGNGDGTFKTQQTYNVGSGPSALTLKDFDGNGTLDIAVVNMNDNTLSVLPGNGDGTFQPQATYPVGNQGNTAGQALLATDINGDGKLDLVVANPASNSVGVLLGNGNGTFQTQQTYAAGNGPSRFVVGDFNADGAADIAVVNSGDSTVGIMLGGMSATATLSNVAVAGIGDPLVTAAYVPGSGSLYAPSTSNATSTSNRVVPLLTVTGGSFVYDGTAHAATCSANAGGIFIPGSCTFLYAPGGATTPTGVGTYTATATFTPSNALNYASTTGSGSIAITVATPALTLNCSEVTFDGNAHSCTGSATGAGGFTLNGSWSFSPASESTAGSYPVTGTFTSGNSNYVSGGTVTSGTLIIDPATPILLLNCPAMMADGNPHACSGTATGVGGAAVSGSFSYSPASETAIGSYPVTAIFTSGDPDYNSGIAQGTLILTKAPQPKVIPYMTSVEAKVPVPDDVVVDLNGNVYVASYGFVYKLDATSGAKSVFAGGGTSNAPCSGRDANVNGAQDKYNDGCPATAVYLYGIKGLAIDAKYLYIDDGSARQLHRVGLSNSPLPGQSFAHEMELVAATKDHPFGLAVDSKGNLFWGDGGNVVMANYSTNPPVLSTVTSPTPNHCASFVNGLAFDKDGDLYFVDKGCYSLYKMTPNSATGVVDGTGAFATLVGNGSKGTYPGPWFNTRGTPAFIGTLRSVATAGRDPNTGLSNTDDLYISTSNGMWFFDADTGWAHQIMKSAATANLGCPGHTTWPYIGCPAPNATFEASGSVGAHMSVDLYGNLYLTDYNSQQVTKVAMGTDFAGTAPAVSVTPQTPVTQMALIHGPGDCTKTTLSATAPFAIGTLSCSPYSVGDQQMDWVVPITYTPTATGEQSGTITVGGATITLDGNGSN